MLSTVHYEQLFSKSEQQVFQCIFYLADSNLVLPWLYSVLALLLYTQSNSTYRVLFYINLFWSMSLHCESGRSTFGVFICHFSYFIPLEQDTVIIGVEYVRFGLLWVKYCVDLHTVANVPKTPWPFHILLLIKWSSLVRMLSRYIKLYTFPTFLSHTGENKLYNFFERFSLFQIFPEGTIG